MHFRTGCERGLRQGALCRSAETLCGAGANLVRADACTAAAELIGARLRSYREAITTSSGRALLFILTALVLPCSAYSQTGGGGIGAASLGFRTTGQQLGIEAVPIEDAITGRWRIEFRVRRSTEDPEATGVWRTVTADVSIAGPMVTGRIRGGKYPADFRCSIDEYGRCLNGRLRFFEDDQNWQEFVFILDRDGYRAEGWAVFMDIRSGAVREYELVMRKR
jgi:hypothetical protein